MYKFVCVKKVPAHFRISEGLLSKFSWHHGGYKEPKEQLAASIYRLMTEPIVDIPK